MTAPPDLSGSIPQPPNLRGRVSTSLSMEAFQGPIPPPAVLESYERIVPGAAERILKMAENQAVHRQGIEQIVVRSGSRDSLWGIIVAAVIAICAFGWSAYALSIGQTGEAVKGIIATICGFVVTFIYGKRSTRLERENRARRSRPE